MIIIHRLNNIKAADLVSDFLSILIIKLDQAIERMKQEVGEGKELKVEYLIVDLASFASVKDFIKTFKERNLPLHILVNNAAVAWIPFSEL